MFLVIVWSDLISYLFHMKFSPFLLLLAGCAVYGQEMKSYQYTFPETGVSFRMIAVSGGKFIIGSNAAAREDDEVPQKQIELSPFWIGEKEVTFGEWDLFFKDFDYPQSKKIDGVTRPTAPYIDLTKGMGRQPDHPVNSISQTAAMMYCRWLYTKTGVFYRLPTEAEWEYACRAGTKTDRPFGDDPSKLKEYGFFSGNSNGKFQPVGSAKPNAWGIYDMLGNLSEWTIDQYFSDYYQRIEPKDPITTPGSRYPRTVRGGSFADDAGELRCANRIPSEAAWNKSDPQVPKSQWWLTDGGFVGFRIVRPTKQPSKEEIEKFYDRYLKN
jgi:formylglycine-generating enzyme required for sulfatase activity